MNTRVAIWTIVISVLLHVALVVYVLREWVIAPLEPPPRPIDIVQAVDLPPPPPPPPPPDEPPPPREKPRVVPRQVPPPPVAVKTPPPPLPIPPQPPVKDTSDATTTFVNETLPPQPAVRVAPKYPNRALEAEKEGRVFLEVTVTPDGVVVDVKVVSASPAGWFEDAAMNAVRRWRYTPAKTGRRFRVEVEFKLN